MVQSIAISESVQDALGDGMQGAIFLKPSAKSEFRSSCRADVDESIATGLEKDVQIDTPALSRYAVLVSEDVESNRFRPIMRRGIRVKKLNNTRAEDEASSDVGGNECILGGEGDVEIRVVVAGVGQTTPNDAMKE